MVGAWAGAQTAAVAVEALSGDPVHAVDSIELPAIGSDVIARAERRDAYPIVVTRSPEETIERLLQVVDGAHVAVITDETVGALYGPLVVGALQKAGVEPEIATVPAGERHKTLRQAFELLDWLTGTQIGRRDVVVTLGGGVVIDMGGWVASSYMRGVPYVNLPTTLVGQVDAGIGGKLAVNHAVAKNLIGGFFQPRGVISDISFLRTLERRALRAGLAESIKKAIIASPAYWELIETRAGSILSGEPDALARLVHGASAIKAELIARDPYEEDSRRTLGFGHALAHPLETVTGYGQVLHGEAVAFGMVVEARMSAVRGLLAGETLDRILGLLRAVGLPTTAAELGAPLDGERLLEAVDRIRMIRGGGYRFVLPMAVGETVIADDVTAGELRSALRECGIDLAE
jgi:3-dehydroquinate synthase